jgi:thiol-disulfide isomerase/thioredoxin
MMFISLGIGAAVAIVLITIVSYLTGGTVTTPTTTSPLLGRAVPSFTATALDGRSVTAPWHHGRPTLLVFLASWCAPCRAELPRLSQYLRANAPAALAVVGVNYNDAPSSARALLASAHVTFPVVPDSGAITVSDFGFVGLPDTVLVSSTGHVLAVHVGVTSNATLRADIALAR